MKVISFTAFALYIAIGYAAEITSKDGYSIAGRILVPRAQKAKIYAFGACDIPAAFRPMQAAYPKAEPLMTVENKATKPNLVAAMKPDEKALYNYALGYGTGVQLPRWFGTSTFPDPALLGKNGPFPGKPSKEFTNNKDLYNIDHVFETSIMQRFLSKMFGGGSGNVAGDANKCASSSALLIPTTLGAGSFIQNIWDQMPGFETDSTTRAPTTYHPEFAGLSKILNMAKGKVFGGRLADYTLLVDTEDNVEAQLVHLQNVGHVYNLLANAEVSAMFKATCARMYRVFTAVDLVIQQNPELAIANQWHEDWAAEFEQHMRTTLKTINSDTQKWVMDTQKMLEGALAAPANALWPKKDTLENALKDFYVEFEGIVDDTSPFLVDANLLSFPTTNPIDIAAGVTLPDPPIVIAPTVVVRS